MSDFTMTLRRAVRLARAITGDRHSTIAFEDDEFEDGPEIVLDDDPPPYRWTAQTVSRWSNAAGHGPTPEAALGKLLTDLEEDARRQIAQIDEALARDVDTKDPYTEVVRLGRVFLGWWRIDIAVHPSTRREGMHRATLLRGVGEHEGDPRLEPVEGLTPGTGGSGNEALLALAKKITLQLHVERTRLRSALEGEGRNDH